MNKIREIQRRLERTYASMRHTTSEVPLPLQALEWVSFARAYAEAATAISNAAPPLWLPGLQLTGQAVESALKANLAAAGVNPPTDHDLVKLYCMAAECGVDLPEFEQACIVHLNHFYHKDLATGTRFKARYPTGRSEYLGGAVPDSSVFSAIVYKLCQHAELANEKDLVPPKT